MLSRDWSLKQHMNPLLFGSPLPIINDHSRIPFAPAAPKALCTCDNEPHTSFLVGHLYVLKVNDKPFSLESSLTFVRAYFMEKKCVVFFPSAPFYLCGSIKGGGT